MIDYNTILTSNGWRNRGSCGCGMNAISYTHDSAERIEIRVIPNVNGGLYTIRKGGNDTHEGTRLINLPNNIEAINLKYVVV